jgi:hypothetical protein
MPSIKDPGYEGGRAPGYSRTFFRRTAVAVILPFYALWQAALGFDHALRIALERAAAALGRAWGFGRRALGELFGLLAEPLRTTFHALRRLLGQVASVLTLVAHPLSALLRGLAAVVGGVAAWLGRALPWLWRVFGRVLGWMRALGMPLLRALDAVVHLLWAAGEAAGSLIEHLWHLGYRITVAWARLVRALVHPLSVLLMGVGRALALLGGWTSQLLDLIGGAVIALAGPLWRLAAGIFREVAKLLWSRLEWLLSLGGALFATAAVWWAAWNRACARLFAALGRMLIFPGRWLWRPLAARRKRAWRWFTRAWRDALLAIEQANVTVRTAARDAVAELRHWFGRKK